MSKPGAPNIDVDDIFSTLGIKIGGGDANKTAKKKPKKKSEKKTEEVPNEEKIEKVEKVEKVVEETKQTNKDDKKKGKNNKKVEEEPKISAQALKIKALQEKAKKEKEERDRLEAIRKAQIEEEKRRIEEEKRKIIEQKEEKKRLKLERIQKAKDDGTYLYPAQKKKLQKELEARNRLELFRAAQSAQAKTVEVEVQQVIPEPKEIIVEKKEEKVVDEVLESWEDAISDESDEEEVEEEVTEEKKVDLRAAICCVLGHVDTGKTKILDKIRHTNVQEGEAGGITQQIGATFFPIESLAPSIDSVRNVLKFEYEIPGLLMIDTPGHESFSNLRTRGSSLCDISILVVDIMHGLERQTLESLNLLSAKKCPFIVALNKIDRIYDWKVYDNESFINTLKKQPSHSKDEFEKRLKSTILAFNENGYNAALYYNNDDPMNTISLVPTSAHTGQGIPDLLGYMTYICQKNLKNRLIYHERIDCTVLELKTTEGFGTTIDVILVNGTLKRDDRIVLCGLNGPIVTEMRVLLTPEPMKEIRTKTTYIRHNAIKAAMGIRISAPDLDECVPGTPLFVCNNDEELEYYKTEVVKDLSKLKMNFKKCEEGVWVQSSSLGSLEALLDFLSSAKPPVPVSGFNIGPLRRRDIIEASVVLTRKPEYGVILAFDIKIDNEIETLIKQNGLKLFSEQIIYRLFDSFTQYMDETIEKKHKVNEDVIFPCELACTDNVFRNKDPIVIGIDVLQGILKVGTPVAAIKIDGTDRKIIEVGKIISIESNKVAIDNVKPGSNTVAISIQPGNENQRKMQYGRTFDQTFKLYSRVTRASIDVMKNEYRDKLQPNDWLLLKQLKEYYNII